MKIVVCHRMPERSFHWMGKPLPLCARCTGVLAGQVVGVTAFWQAVAWWLCLLAVIPLLIDWSAQHFLSVPSTNLRRFITGLLAGYGEVALAVLACRYVFGL